MRCVRREGVGEEREGQSLFKIKVNDQDGFNVI